MKRRVTLSLSFPQRKSRAGLILDQATLNRKTYERKLVSTPRYVDKLWFYLIIREREGVRMFLDEEKVGSTKAQHESHIPTIIMISICVIRRPDPSRGFAGSIGVWRVCAIKEAAQNSTRRAKEH